MNQTCTAKLSNQFLKSNTYHTHIKTFQKYLRFEANRKIKKEITLFLNGISVTFSYFSVSLTFKIILKEVYINK